MGCYRKKPIVIEAYTVTAILRNAVSSWKNMPDPIKIAYDKGDVVLTPEAIFITTLEGKMRAEVGDWIIKGVKGELYPCKPDIFDATYEPITEDVIE